MKRIALACLLLAACGRHGETPQEQPPSKRATRPPTPELEPPAEPSKDERRDTSDAASALKLYYSRIEAGDYDSAWSMRTGESGEEARRRFADNFKAYERYHADVGEPSQPVQSNGSAYVEVPVMIRGAFRGGKSFATAGSVTLRRPAEGGGWQVFTGDRRH
jgi:predicted small lipoprotein YifL